MKQKWNKPIYYKILQILVINLDQDKKDKDKKQNTFDSINSLYEGQELILNAFRSGIFPIKEKKRKGIKILTPKQMLQILPNSTCTSKSR